MKYYYLTVVILTIFACVFMATRSKAPPTHSEFVGTGTEVVTPCCLCDLKHEGSAELRTYGGPRLCENLSGQEYLGECKRINVLGEQCSFYTMTLSGKKSKCDAKAVTYFENGMRKTIEPPKNALSPCDAKTTLTGMGTMGNILPSKRGNQ